MNTQSLMRHLLTWGAAILTLILTSGITGTPSAPAVPQIGAALESKHVIAADQVAAVNDAGAEVLKQAAAANTDPGVYVHPLGVILSVLAVALMRWLIALAGKKFPPGALGLLLIGTSTAAGFLGLVSLSSCTADQMNAAKSIPIKTKIITSYGTAVYSSKGGLELDIDAQSGK